MLLGGAGPVRRRPPGSGPSATVIRSTALNGGTVVVDDAPGGLMKKSSLTLIVSAVGFAVWRRRRRTRPRCRSRSQVVRSNSPVRWVSCAISTRPSACRKQERVVGGDPAVGRVGVDRPLEVADAAAVGGVGAAVVGVGLERVGDVVGDEHRDGARPAVRGHGADRGRRDRPRWSCSRSRRARRPRRTCGRAAPCACRPRRARTRG